MWYYEQCPGVCCFQLPLPTEITLPPPTINTTPRLLRFAQQHARLRQTSDVKLRDYECIVTAAAQQREGRPEGELNMVTEETVHRFVPSVSTNPRQTPSEDRPKSELEILAEQRDYRRRRQTYRAKNVHITKRTPTQIQRDIIFYLFKEIYGEEVATHHLYHHHYQQQQSPSPIPLQTTTEPKEPSQFDSRRRDSSSNTHRRSQERQSYRDKDNRERNRDSVEKERVRKHQNTDEKHHRDEYRHRDRDRSSDRERDKEHKRDKKQKDRHDKYQHRRHHHSPDVTNSSDDERDRTKRARHR